jgi:phosphoribosylaminoimidazole-succinocarboxamide synthase
LKNNGIRAQIVEVVVRQAIAGARWREICAAAMQANQITPEQIEEEMSRRQGGVERPSTNSHHE